MASLTLLTFGIGALVGQEFVSDLANTLYNKLLSIFSNTNPVVIEVLNELDIYNSLVLIKTVILEINKYTIKDDKISQDELCNKIENKIDNYVIVDSDLGNIDGINAFIENIDPNMPFISKSLTVCLMQLNNVINSVYEEVNKINDGYNYHQTIWFKRFRTPKYLTNIENLKRLKNIMDNRYDNLLKLMNIYLRLDYKLFSSTFSPQNL